jgi:hypothetical protein
MKKVLLIGISGIITLVSLPGCIVQQYQDYETYYETENRTESKTESYVTTEDVVTVTNQGEEFIRPNMQWFNSAITADSSRPLYYYGYIVPMVTHSKMDIRIVITHNQYGTVKVYAGGAFIPIAPTIYTRYFWYPTVDPQWLDSLNAFMTTAKVLATTPLEDMTKDSISFSVNGVPEFAIFVDGWDSTAISEVKLVWADQLVTKRNVTKERQVSVTVPYQVEKKRPVTKERKVPVWEFLWSGKDSSKK